MSRRVLAAILAAFVAIVSVSCGSSDGDKEQGPALPPVSTMELDLSAFSAGGAKGDLPKSNFNNAALRVGVLKVYAVVALAAPVAVLGAALSVDPVFEDGKWIWEFSTTSGGQSYKAVLSGWFDGNLKTGAWLELEMKVTCPTCKPALTDYVWQTGRFNLDGKEGNWTFYSPEVTGDDQRLVTIDYTYTDDTHRTLDVKNVRKDGHETAGDTIEYAQDGADVTLTVHDESEQLDYSAAANADTGAGWLQVPNYNNGDKACWDEDQLNADCP